VERLANDIESFGAPEFQRPPRRVRRRYAARYLIALGVVTSLLFGVDSLLPQSLPWFGTAVLLPLVPLAAHFKWKHRGYWLGDDHVVTRNGVLKRQIKVVPYYRIQTVIDSRTIFQRRWKLATVTVDTAGSLSLTQQDAAAVDVDAETAASLRGTLGERLRSALAARRSAGRPGPGPRGTEPATLSEGNTHGPVNGAPEDESAETDVSVDDGPGTDPPEGDGAEGERGDRDASRDDSPSDESDRETDRGSNAEAGGEAESTETRDAG
jgi:putative membrane protein